MGRRSRRHQGSQRHPVAANAAIEHGDTVMLLGGYAQTVANAVNGGVVGVNEGPRVDNTGGAAGDKYVDVSEGIFEFSGTFTITDNNTTMYASGPQSVSGAQVGNWPAIGRGRYWKPDSIEVMVSPEAAALPPV